MGVVTAMEMAMVKDLPCIVLSHESALKQALPVLEFQSDELAKELGYGDGDGDGDGHMLLGEFVAVCRSAAEALLCSVEAGSARGLIKTIWEKACKGLDGIIAVDDILDEDFRPRDGDGDGDGDGGHRVKAQLEARGFRVVVVQDFPVYIQQKIENSSAGSKSCNGLCHHHHHHHDYHHHHRCICIYQYYKWQTISFTVMTRVVILNIIGAKSVFKMKSVLELLRLVLCPSPSPSPFSPSPSPYPSQES